MDYPQAIKNLADLLKKLPGVGAKTAQRYVFSLLKESSEDLKQLGNQIENLAKTINKCPTCFYLSEEGHCPICQDKTRDNKKLCLIESFSDLINIENTKQYKGRYFVLGNLINSIEDIGPKDIHIEELVKFVNNLIKENGELEIILALSPTLEGEGTSMYLNKALKSPKIKLSKLARGLPSGATLEYADEITLISAFKNRNEI